MKRAKVILILLLVFGAGFVGGVVATRIVVRRAIRVAIEQPERVRDRLEREIARKLQLDTAQRTKLHEEAGKAHERLRSLRRTFQPRMAEIVIELRDTMKPLLRPDQLQRLEELQREHPNWLQR